MAPRTMTVRAGQISRDVQIEEDGTLVIEGTRVRATAAPAPNEWIVSDGVSIERVFVVVVGDTTWAFYKGEAYELAAEAAGSAPRRAHHQGSLTAPMPATVISVHVRAGDRVERNAILVVLEAMKMELPVRAPAAGTVTLVNCQPGDLVQPGTALVEMQ
jgi:biotin carboxyl carrier protein